MQDNLSFFQEAAQTNLWGAILPEIFVGLLACSLLVLEMVLPKERQALIPRVAGWGLTAILGWYLLFFHAHGGGHLNSVTFAGMLHHDALGQIMRAFFLLAGILVCYLASLSLKKQRVPRTEFYHILLVITGAMMLLAQSHSFVMLFVALETIAVGLYILVSYYRHTPASLEAGLKYLILGALSSSLLLFGIVLLYGAAGNPDLAGHTAHGLNFANLRAFLEQNPDNLLVIAGMVLVLCGISFKIAAVPFQVWVPDVYQGAPTPVTAFLAVASKAAGFALLLSLVRNVFQPLQDVIIPTLSILAILTILVGNLGALGQRNAKRLIGFSGIAHAGYLLVGVTAAVTIPGAAGAVVFYLFVYLLASFAVFGVMAHLAGDNDADLQVAHSTELLKRAPFLGAVLVIGLGSLAGIPPLAGFIGKLLIFVAAFQAGLYLLLGVAIIGVVISISYYFGWMRTAIFRRWQVVEGAPNPDEQPIQALTLSSKALLGLLAGATVFLGLIQAPLTAWLGGLW